MPTIKCPKCGRAIADSAQRCLYCGKTLDPAAAGEADKRAAMLAALYSAGVGIAAPRSSWLERQRDEPFLVKAVIAAGILPVALLWPPLAWKWMKVLFRP